MIFVYFGISKLEKLYSPNKMAELFYLLIFNIVSLIIVAYLLDENVMAKGLAFSILYIWCKKSPLEKV